jgi:hypothetical protein
MKLWTTSKYTPYIQLRYLVHYMAEGSKSSWNPFSKTSKFADMSVIYAKGTDIDKDLPEIKPFLQKWARNAMILRFLQVLLGFLATFFSLLTATVLTVQNTDNYNFYAKIFAFIAAVSIGLITAFDLGTKSNNMTDAWRHLTAAAIRYNKGLCKKEVVINAYAKGEKTIGNVTFNQQQKQGVGSELDEGNKEMDKSFADELAKLAKLKEQGEISESQYLQIKEKLIRNYS